MPDDSPKPTPPYLPYSTFKSKLLGLAEDGGLPTVIDKSALPSLSGGDRSLFLATCRYFGLIDESGTPSDVAKEIAVEGNWAVVMRGLLQEHMAGPVAELKNGTPDSLGNALKAIGVSSSVIDKSSRFIIAAANDCDFAVAKLLTRRKPRSAGGKGKGKAKAKGKGGAADDSSDEEGQSPEGFDKYEVITPKGFATGELRLPTGLARDDINVIWKNFGAIKAWLEHLADMAEIENDAANGAADTSPDEDDDEEDESAPTE